MDHHLFSKLFGSNINNQGATQQVNLAEAQEQRRRLTTVVADLEKDQRNQQTAVVYDPVLRVSQVFKVDQQHANQDITIKQPKQKKQSSLLTLIGRILSCSSCTEKTKPKSGFEMITVLFDALKSQQSSWLQRHYNRYSLEELGQLRQEHVGKMIRVLGRVRQEVEGDRVDGENKQSALACIAQLQSTYKSLTPQKHTHHLPSTFFTIRTQNHSLLMLMISAYTTFSHPSSYTTYNRLKLKSLYHHLQQQNRKSVQNSIEVLRFLQNKDPMVGELRPLEQGQIDELVDLWIYDYMRVKGVGGMDTRIGLVRVSGKAARRRVVNLLVSGFLSEDKNKKQQWDQLLACMPDSQVYGLQWESNTITRLVKFLILSIKDLLLGKDLTQLLTQDNPFIPAFQVSIQAGQMLAYIVHKIFPFQFVNIIGYSLGSQLIRSFISKSIQLNGGRNINKVISMGGVSDVTQFQQTLKKSKQTINVLNCRSKRDSILRYVLKRAKPNIRPLGLNDLDEGIQNHFIKNVDVSKQINGHFAFMTNFGTIAQILKLNEE